MTDAGDSTATPESDAGAQNGAADSIRDRLRYVEARLAYEVDVVAARAAQSGGAVIVDTRKQRSWDHGHVTGALHLPNDRLSGDLDEVPTDRTLIVYGWGPGCNGETSTARVLLDRGYDVREMIGGYEYWVRNGFPVEGVTADGTLVDLTRPADPLVTAE
ncbi:rhodanese-like domain-containing protein [Microbacterium sp. MPKO10]|uniref:rhodanese-like domain-containing protein n=1 Tax=Microbacterium sp. MPKO10 TaxID=2989818 RepID=UPI002236B2F8|nr:rhodanese-like domain-containing protein [Microbacterium sp. MPKO10]MCW4459238.1 rhodanese-like domain-containing protein [Microbacterium sp. MPKO10]